MDWSVVLEKQDPTGNLSTTFSRDEIAKLAKQLSIILACDRNVLLHVISQQDPFCAPEDLCSSRLGVQCGL